MAGKKINGTHGERAGKYGARHSSSIGSGAEMLSKDAWKVIARSCALSPREVQIIRGIFDNHTEDGIAGLLGISRHTIHTYLTRIFRKLDATTRTQVVLRIMQRFLVLSEASDETLRPICARSKHCRFAK